VTARALLAGPGALRTLTAGGEGRLEVALGAGGYVRLAEDRWLLVAGPRAPIGPLSLLVAGLGAESSVPGWPARRRGSDLVLGPLRIELADLPTPPPRPAPSGAAVEAGPALGAALGVIPVPPDALRPGIDALARGDLPGAVAQLAGRGEGLTPAGDDVLAGYAAWSWTANRPVALTRLAAGRASPLGLAYLGCAERGEIAEPAAAVLAAVRSGEPARAARRARALDRWGASSGWALLWGMAAGSGREVLSRELVERPLGAHGGGADLGLDRLQVEA